MSGDWNDRSACGPDDLATFYAYDGATQAKAKAICAGCPVREECLAYALNTKQPEGIWGGATERERLMMMGKARMPAEPEHGTAAGYKQHFRVGTAPCQLCRTAQTMVRRQERERNRARRYQEAV